MMITNVRIFYSREQWVSMNGMNYAPRRTDEQKKRICSLVCKWTFDFCAVSGLLSYCCAGSWLELAVRASSGLTHIYWTWNLNHYHALHYIFFLFLCQFGHRTVYGLCECCVFLHLHKFILSLFSYSFVSLIFSLFIFISFSFVLRFFIGIGYCIIFWFLPQATCKNIYSVDVDSGQWTPLASAYWGQRILVSLPNEKKPKPKIEYTVSSRKKSILYFYGRIREAVNLQRQFPIDGARAFSHKNTTCCCCCCLRTTIYTITFVHHCGSTCGATNFGKGNSVRNEFDLNYVWSIYHAKCDGPADGSRALKWEKKKNATVAATVAAALATNKYLCTTRELDGFMVERETQWRWWQKKEQPTIVMHNV